MSVYLREIEIEQEKENRWRGGTGAQEEQPSIFTQINQRTCFACILF